MNSYTQACRECVYLQNTNPPPKKHPNDCNLTEIDGAQVRFAQLRLSLCMYCMRAAENASVSSAMYNH